MSFFTELLSNLVDAGELNETGNMDVPITRHFDRIQTDMDRQKTDEDDGEDMDDDDDSDEEENEQIVLEKLFEILNERIDVFFSGPPGSGKTDFILHLQNLIGCTVIFKPNMTFIKCSADNQLTQTHNLFELMQKKPAEYSIEYIIWSMIEQITDAKQMKSNNKITLFENAPNDLLSVYLENALALGHIDLLKFHVALQTLIKLYDNAKRERTFNPYKIFVMIDTNFETCKQRLASKNETLLQRIASQKRFQASGNNMNAGQGTNLSHSSTSVSAQFQSSQGRVSSSMASSVGYVNHTTIPQQQQQPHPSQQQLAAAPSPQTMTMLSSQQQPSVYTNAEIERDTLRLLSQPLITNKANSPMTAAVKANGIVTAQSSGFGFDKNNLRSNTLAENINAQFTQTEVPSVEQIEQRSSIMSDGCLKNLITAYEKLRKDELVKRKYGYCERSSKLAVVTLPDSSTLDYSAKANNMIKKLGEIIEERRKKRIIDSFSEIERKILKKLFRSESPNYIEQFIEDYDESDESEEDGEKNTNNTVKNNLGKVKNQKDERNSNVNKQNFDKKDQDLAEKKQNIFKIIERNQMLGNETIKKMVLSVIEEIEQNKSPKSSNLTSSIASGSEKTSGSNLTNTNSTRTNSGKSQSADDGNTTEDEPTTLLSNNANINGNKND